jgi:hypothetical protein
MAAVSDFWNVITEFGRPSAGTQRRNEALLLATVVFH